MGSGRKNRSSVESKHLGARQQDSDSWMQASLGRDHADQGAQQVQEVVYLVDVLEDVLITRLMFSEKMEVHSMMIHSWWILLGGLSALALDGVCFHVAAILLFQ